MAALRERARQGELRLECPAAGEGTTPKLSLELDCGRQLRPADALAGAFAISREISSREISRDDESPRDDSRDPLEIGRLVLTHTPAVPQAYFPVASNIEVRPTLAHARPPSPYPLSPVARRPSPAAPSRCPVVLRIYTA